MNTKEIREIRQKISECEDIEDKANCPADKIIAGYLIKKLKYKLLNLLYPKPEEL